MKKYCPAFFLDVSQAWHKDLLFMIKKMPPTQYFQLLSLYLDKRMSISKMSGEIWDYHMIRSGVPQVSILDPLLYARMYQRPEKQP